MLVIVAYILTFHALLLGYFPAKDAFAKLDLAEEFNYFLMIFHRILAFNIITYQPTTPHISELILTYFIHILRNPLVSYLVTIIIFAEIGFIGMYLFLIFLAERSYLMASLLSFYYVISIPYVNEALRGHLGIILGFSLFPWISYPILNIVKESLNPSKPSGSAKPINLFLNNTLLLALVLSIALTSQQYIAVLSLTEIIVIIAVEYLVLIIYNKEKCKHILRGFVWLALAVSLAIALSSWYWVPLVMTGKLNFIEQGKLVPLSFKYKAEYSESFLNLISLLPAHFSELLHKGAGIYYYYVLLPALPLMLITLGIIINKKQHSFYSRLLIPLLVLFIISDFLSLGPQTTIYYLIKKIPIIRIMREYYYYIGLSLFAYISIIAVLKGINARHHKSTQKHVDKARHRRNTTPIIPVLSAIIIITILLFSSILFISQVNYNAIFIKKRSFADIINAYRLVSSEFSIKNSVYTLSIPGGWTSVYAVLNNNNTKTAINGLFMASGVLAGKPVFILNTRTPFTESEPFIGSNSLIKKELYYNTFSLTGLIELLRILDTRYILLHAYSIYNIKLVSNLYNNLKKESRLLTVEYNGRNAKLLAILRACVAYRLPRTLPLFIGSLSSLTEYIDSLGNDSCNTAPIFYSYLLKSSFPGLLEILRHTNAVVFSNGASYLDIVYLLYRASKYSQTIIIKKSKDIKVIDSTNLSKFLVTSPYKYALTPAYIMKKGTSITIITPKVFNKSSTRYVLAFKSYVKPVPLRISIYRANFLGKMTLLRTINLEHYPGFGYIWVVLSNLSLSKTKQLIIRNSGKTTLVDSLMLIPSNLFKKYVKCVNKILLNKTVIYLISPNDYPIIGSNVHVQKSAGAINGYILLVPWHKYKHTYFEIRKIFIPKFKHITALLFIKMLKRKPLRYNLTTCIVNTKAICKINGKYLIISRKISKEEHYENILFDVVNTSKSEEIDYLELIIRPEKQSMTQFFKGNCAIAISATHSVFTNNIIAINIKCKNRSSSNTSKNINILLLPFIYNKYMYAYIKIGTTKENIDIMPMLGLSAVYLGKYIHSNETTAIHVYLCIRYQKLFTLLYIFCFFTIVVLIFFLLCFNVFYQYLLNLLTRQKDYLGSKR